VQLERTFRVALGEINSELWASLVGLAQIESVSKWIAPLDGTDYEKALQSALPMVRESLLKRIRLTNAHLSTDLMKVCRSASKWMFAYFTVLVRSLAENNVRNRVAELDAAQPAFRNALRARAKRAKKSKGQIIDQVAQELCRGQHGWFARLFPAYDGTTGQLDKLLAKSNKVRNTLAHRLLEKRASTALSERRWISLTSTLQDLMRRLP
jgi:hypothetical protein